MDAHEREVAAMILQKFAHWVIVEGQVTGYPFPNMNEHDQRETLTHRAKVWLDRQPALGRELLQDLA